MRLFVVLFAVLAVAAAAVVPNAGEPTQFASQRMSVEAANDDEELLPGHHTFYTRQDHSRPQVRVPVRFVSVALLAGRGIYYYRNQSDLVCLRVELCGQLGALPRGRSVLHLLEGRLRGIQQPNPLGSDGRSGPIHQRGSLHL